MPTPRLGHARKALARIEGTTLTGTSTIKVMKNKLEQKLKKAQQKVLALFVLFPMYELCHHFPQTNCGIISPQTTHVDMYHMAGEKARGTLEEEGENVGMKLQERTVDESAP